MKHRNWHQLLAVLIVASILITAASQRFDKIIAKSIITTSSSGITLNGGGTLDLASGGLTLDSGDVTLTAGDLTVTAGDETLTAGDLALTAGNMTIGNATPTFTQTGEDLYVEGTVELATDLIMGPQSTISVVFGIPITPTGWYQPIQSADFGTGAGQAVTPIAAPANDTNGTRLLLYNINASQVITIDGTGTTVECKADIVLGSTDTLELFWNGDDWKCIANYDNS